MSKQVLICLYFWIVAITANEELIEHMSNNSACFCQTGLFFKDGHCRCGVYPYNTMYCNGTHSFLLSRYCATFDDNNQLLSVGSCLHTPDPHGQNHTAEYYHLLKGLCLPNNSICRHLKRTGTLCGRCLPDHYPLAYSYNSNCVRCSHVRWNWVTYIMAAYLPLTLFYLVIMFFKINTTSSQLFALVYYCQTMSMPSLVRRMFVSSHGTREVKYKIAYKFYSTLYGMWNMDFFRSFYSDFCLGIGILPALALDYAIAIYPLFLMIVSYLLIVLYDRNYRVVIIMWRPFQLLFSVFRKKWDIRTSVVDAFSTFFLLSNAKFISTSFDLLTPTRVYHLYGDTYNYTLALYYSGDIEYFGREHLPYGILAIVMLSVFFILPVATLALYPFAFFQKFLALFSVRWYILHTFMDSFHGSYKNGTEPNTRDHRWFASSFFIIRCCLFLQYFSTTIDLFSCLASAVLLFHTSLLVIFQPFKPSKNRYNTIHIIFLLILILFAVLQAGHKFATVFKPRLVILIEVLSAACLASPVIYALAWTLHWLYTHRRSMIDGLRARITGYTPLPEQTLPDRIENSGEYPKENLANFA